MDETRPPIPGPPEPVLWEHTYVSLTGANGQGEEIPLTGHAGNRWPGIWLQAGATGLDAPPYELHSDDSPNLDGSIYRSTRVTQREVMLPLYLYGVDRRTLREQKRRLTQALDPQLGYVALKFVEADGQARILRAYYKGGLEGNEAEDRAGFTWAKYGLVFTALDPWFYSDTEQVADWSFGTGQPMLGKLLPLRLSSGSRTATDLPIYNRGDCAASPIWTLTGPVMSFRISYGTRSFGIDADPVGLPVIPAGTTLTIDTRPGIKTIRDDKGTNFYPRLADNPQFWGVPVGRSTARVEVIAGSGTASVRLKFEPRYASY
ncbi:phage tail family protein [Kitasatospora sp. NPDC096147]|uniref:phage tail family protein n=1 Tax=Kitasatospora sp. NPDC096147 TaxID=3364093 RepID=UPI00382204BA